MHLCFSAGSLTGFFGSLLWTSCEVRVVVGHQLQPTHKPPDWMNGAAPWYMHARCEPHSLNHPWMKNKLLVCRLSEGRGGTGSHIYHKNALNVKSHAHLSPPMLVSACKCDSPSQQVIVTHIHNQENDGLRKRKTTFGSGHLTSLMDLNTWCLLY